MPSLILQTNVEISDPKSFVLNFSKAAAAILDKPERYIAISYRHNEYLSFSGTFGPAFLLEITSMDNITPERNVAYSKDLFEFLKNELGTPGGRGYITFNDPGREYLGHEGTTIAQIFGKREDAK